MCAVKGLFGCSRRLCAVKGEYVVEGNLFVIGGFVL